MKACYMLYAVTEFKHMVERWVNFPAFSRALVGHSSGHQSSDEVPHTP